VKSDLRVNDPLERRS